MRFTYILPVLFAIFVSELLGGTVDSARICDFSRAGLQDDWLYPEKILEIEEFGAVGDGNTACDKAIAEALAAIPGTGAIIRFGEGDYYFENSVSLPSNVVLQGLGPDLTALIFNLTSPDDAIKISGTSTKGGPKLTESAKRGSRHIVLESAGNFAPGDLIKIIFDDSDLVTSDWAKSSVGQIITVESVAGNTVYLASPLRLDYPSEKNPRVIEILPAENSGVECLKILREDNTAPKQTSNISLSYARNCLIRGVESQFCTFAHVDIRNSTNIEVETCSFSEGFEYGGGGRAYGAVLHSTSGQCLIENNIFRRLRHSMLVQSGANANVFAYNYSREAKWDDVILPEDAAGDIVLHGNYPYLNLFEGNICQNIVIDNSHGPNGPYNTFFRNRAERWGIFFSAANSPNQNIVGNEISNKNLPYSILNFTILGSGHFLFGNNDKGTVKPAGTGNLPEQSLFRSEAPEYFVDSQFGGIGPPEQLGSATIPARERYFAGDFFGDICAGTSDVKSGEENSVSINPNPAENEIYISADRIIACNIYSLSGQLLISGASSRIDVSTLPPGIYIIIIETPERIYRKLIAIE